jgi:hypothetical protein
MTGSKSSHIRVTRRIGEGETIRIYAVADGTLSEAQLWLSQQTLPNGRDLQVWLGKKGCRLDSSNGPAFILRSAFGATLEMYYRAGTLYRKDGPAVVWADGLTAEEIYLRNGQLDRQDGPALIERNAKGKIVHGVFAEQGRLIRDERPPRPSAAPRVGIAATPSGPHP